jgi:hypothetical protein
MIGAYGRNESLISQAGVEKPFFRKIFGEAKANGASREKRDTLSAIRVGHSRRQTGHREQRQHMKPPMIVA